ncbi:nucleoporin p58/p45-like isoform X2 [Ornithodoros turicata]|uniref:nucleoporin p58/p45-like isoform X2 n=1 Tax=Ornithodoros turicata TaxID=34597 RepID=UPI00313A381E
MTVPGGGGFSFGTQQTQASPFGNVSFGMQSPQTTTTQSLFGAAPTVPPTGVVQPFSFGAPATGSTQTGTVNPFALSTQQAAPGMNPPLTFGTQTAMAGTAQQPFAFGAVAATTSAPVGTTQPFGFGAAGQTSGFSFNTPATSVPSFGGFGAPTPAQSATPTFGGFGAAQTTQPSVGFGAAPTGFGGFGSTATTTSAPSGGFAGFGTPSTAAPAAVGFTGFGTPATSAPTAFTGFGTQPAQPTGGFTGFGTAPVASTAAPTAAPVAFAGFGKTPAATSASTGFLGFGSMSTTAATTAQVPAQTYTFGAPATSAPSGFTFGSATQPAAAPAATSAAAPAVPFGGLAAATPATTTTATPFAGIGAVTTSASTGFTFGKLPTTTTTTTAGTSTLCGFGLTTTASSTAAPTLTTFGSFATPTSAAATTSAPSLTVTTTTTAAASTPSFSFGGFGTTTTTTAATTTTAGLTFGGSSLLTTTTAAATTAPSVFGASLFPTTTTTTSGAAAPVFGQTATTSTGFSLGSLSSTSAPSLSATASATVPATSSVGLGGVDILPASSAAGSAGGKADKAVKESTLPNEIVQTVESFKAYVNEQKEVREEIFRVSSRLITKVQEETSALRQLLSTIESGIQRNALAIDRLKEDTALELKNAEIAHHTKETPAALQYENTAPTVYFQRLVASFSQQMKLYKQQIEELEQHFASMSSSSSLTPQDLTLLVKRQHETFVSLAAQLHSLHNSVQKRKEEFLSLRRGTSCGLAAEGHIQVAARAAMNNRVPVTFGPAPFSNARSDAALAMALALDRAAQPSVGGLGQLGMQPAPGGGGLNTSGLFGAQSSFSSPSLFGSTGSSFKPLGK